MNDSDKIWYACYGSNLSSKRFRYYIEGGYCSLNKKSYCGCRDKTLWTDFRIQEYPGKLYFANVSKSWGGTGVAYYDPDGKGTVIMRLYKITWDQFQCVQCQEGKSSKWYGKKLLLGTDEDGTLIYTITCEEKSMRNSPSDAYYTLIRNALIDECGLDSEKADAYLEQALQNQP